MTAPSELIAGYDEAMATRTASASIELDAAQGYLPARLPVASLAQGSVAVLAASVNRFLNASGAQPRTWRLSMERICASFLGNAVVRVDGRSATGFAELSGFFEAADGWVRTHGNYPHHRQRLLASLGLDEGDRSAVADRIATLPAQDVEDRALDHHAIAVRVRDEAEWAASDQGRAVAAEPLVINRLRDAPSGSARHRVVDPAAPLSGIRVLDFTRVIAGPVATRTLALLGADVLRIDPPHLPELPAQQEETGPGKYTALLDLATSAGLERANELLQTADILVTGYRPGSLERFGLEYPPGLVLGRVAAWGSTGPWAGRRGFDSIVQAASGIAMVEGDAGRPGVLPAQALDHASGYLLAAAALDALRARDSDGRGRDVTVSLAGMAHWLLQAEGRIEQIPDARWPGEQTIVVHGGTETARPALSEYDDYAWPAHPSGSDPAAWR